MDTKVEPCKKGEHVWCAILNDTMLDYIKSEWEDGAETFELEIEIEADIMCSRCKFTPIELLPERPKRKGLEF